MNNIKLSRRLHALLDWIPAGSRLADIGSDHALLPIAAVESGKATAAVAGEVNPGPFAAATKAVAEAGLSGQIAVRRGDGLEVLKSGEADCITIAGMGGSLIAAILERGRTAGKLEGVRKLVLQPNVGEDLLRRWLLDHGWLLTDERIIEEDGKIYEVLSAIPEAEAGELSHAEVYAEWQPQGGGPVIGQELQLRMGPWLLRAPDRVFVAKWRAEIGKLEGIVRDMSRSDLDSARSKAAELNSLIDTIKEVLECLQKDKL